MKFRFFLFSFFFIFLSENVKAHCPLCTIGAGAAAGAAVYLGVSKVVIGLFIGAFAMSMGYWMGNFAERKYNKKRIMFQKPLIIVSIFLLTVLPLMPIFEAIGPLYLSFIGEYGKTFAINYSLYSSIFGGLIVFISPSLSSRITKLRNGKTIPFQGTSLTLLLLIVIGVLIQLMI